AYTGQHISQFRSTQGRLTIWKRSVELVRTNPPWGVGSGNAALSLLSTADADETTGFASRTFSLPVQVLLEKGTFGFLLYGTFVLLAGIEFMRGMRPVPQPYRLPRRSAKTKGTGDSFQSMQASTIRPARTMRSCFAAGFIAVLVR